ncbi:MAG: hypothetical protein NUV72_08545 [Bauldia sp.]|nr:hypothetical protein [Bauldia sp.]
MRRAHFEVDGIRFDGATKGIVTVETGAATGGERGAAIVRVRAYRRPREAVMLLADVAQIVLERDAKTLAAQMSSQSGRGRR